MHTVIEQHWVVGKLHSVYSTPMCCLQSMVSKVIYYVSRETSDSFYFLTNFYSELDAFVALPVAARSCLADYFSSFCGMRASSASGLVKAS